MAVKRKQPVETTEELSWLPKPVHKHTLHGLAGHPFVLNADQLTRRITDESRIRWLVAGRRFTGRVLRWTPRSPGFFRVNLWVDGRRTFRRVTIGLKPTDLHDRRDDLDYFLCLIFKQDGKVSFVPLLGAGAKRKDGKATKPKRTKAMTEEVRAEHPAFARLLAAQTAIYRDKVLPHPYVAKDELSEGLYAVFSQDLVYLGGSSAIARAVKDVAAATGELPRTALGRGRLLRAIESAVARVETGKLTFGKDALYPRDTVTRRGPFAPERFATGVLSQLLSEVAAFGDQVGVDLRGGDLTSLFTFNEANGSLSTSLFSSDFGFSRQVVSAFELGSVLGAGGDLGGGTSGVDGLGSVDLGSLGGGWSGTGSADSFFGGLSSLSGGISPFAAGGDSEVMDGEGGGSSPGDFPGSDQDGHYVVHGDDGSTVYFHYGADGNPEASAIGPNGELYGDKTVWEADDFEPLVIGPDDGGGDDGGTPDGGTPSGGDDGGGDTPDGGTPEGGGDDGGGEPDGGGDDGGDGGTDGGDDSGGEPPGTDPAEMPAPDDGGGTGGGDPPDDSGGGRGPHGTFGGSPGSRGQPLGVITRGGGFTDPAPDDGTGAGGGGRPLGDVVRPGGGYTDPVDDPAGNGGFGGFVVFGGANPPGGGVTDPMFRGSSGRGAGSRTVTDRGPVRIESFANGDGRSSSGMVGGTTGWLPD